VKTYQVQTWNADGALSNSYLVDLAGSAEADALKKFLRKKSPHVVIHPVASKAKAVRR
jgi:hypothetical protein